MCKCNRVVLCTQDYKSWQVDPSGLPDSIILGSRAQTDRCAVDEAPCACALCFSVSIALECCFCLLHVLPFECLVPAGTNEAGRCNTDCAA